MRGRSSRGLTATCSHRHTSALGSVAGQAGSAAAGGWRSALLGGRPGAPQGLLRPSRDRAPVGRPADPLTWVLSSDFSPLAPFWRRWLRCPCSLPPTPTGERMPVSFLYKAPPRVPGARCRPTASPRWREAAGFDYRQPLPFPSIPTLAATQPALWLDGFVPLSLRSRFCGDARVAQS